MTGYRGIIVEACRCEPAEAPVIEEIMRVAHPTLDHLPRAEFVREARIAQHALAVLRVEDPETVRFYEEQAS